LSIVKLVSVKKPLGLYSLIVYLANQTQCT